MSIWDDVQQTRVDNWYLVLAGIQSRAGTPDHDPVVAGQLAAMARVELERRISIGEHTEYHAGAVATVIGALHRYEDDVRRNSNSKAALLVALGGLGQLGVPVEFTTPRQRGLPDAEETGTMSAELGRIAARC